MSAADQTMSAGEALSVLIAECESANERALDQIGVGLIDLNAIARARAALPAAAPAAVPEGWKLVPIEPTDEMRKAGGHANSEWLNDNAPIGEGRYAMPMLSVWHAMTATAPPAPAVQPVELRRLSAQHTPGVITEADIENALLAGFSVRGDATKSVFWWICPGERYHSRSERMWPSKEDAYRAMARAYLIAKTTKTTGSAP